MRRTHRTVLEVEAALSEVWSLVVAVLRVEERLSGHDGVAAVSRSRGRMKGGRRM